MRKRYDALTDREKETISHRMENALEVFQDRHPGMTQKDIAEKAGINASAMSRIMNADNNITLANLMKLSKALDINLGYLAGIEDELSTNIKKREICKALKISEKAYDQLMEIKESKYVRDRKALNFILENLEYLIEPLGYFLMPKELSGYLFKEDPDDQVMDLDSNDIELLFLEQVRQTLILCKEFKENREKTGKVNGK